MPLMRSCGAACGVAVLACLIACGGGGVAPQTPPKPAIELGPKLTDAGASVGEWRWEPGRGEWVATITLAGNSDERPFGSGAVTAHCFDASGVKLDAAFVSFPTVRPGESAQIRLQPRGDAARVVIELDRARRTGR